MPIQITCGNCGKSISAPDHFAGKAANCPKCKSVIEIPVLEMGGSVEMPIMTFEAAAAPVASQPAPAASVETASAAPIELSFTPPKVAVAATPAAIAPVAAPASKPVPATTKRESTDLQPVRIVSVDIPFVSLVVLVVKVWAIAFLLSVGGWFAVQAIAAALQ